MGIAHKQMPKNQRQQLLFSFPESKAITVLLGILVLFAVGFILHVLGSVFKPLFIALLFSFVFERPINLMRRIKIPKIIAIVVVLVITFVLFYLIGLLIYSNIDTFVTEFPRYQTNFNQFYLNIIGMLKIPHEDVSRYYREIDWSELLQKLSIPKILSSSVGSFMNFLANLFLILLFMVYILLGRDNLIANMGKAFPGKRSEQFNSVFHNINRGMQKYLVAKTLISLGTGLSATIVLLIFGVDFAWIWGLLTFVLNFIPNVGSVIATIPPILVAVFQFDGIFRVFWVALLLITIQMTWGNIIEPAFMGKSLNLSPLVVIFSLIFWGFIWGPIGMILAVPIASAVQIVCANIDTLKPISIMMGDP